ncbi:MAG: hypothetical protein EA349_05810 [Halomonadaceae bacterium]|nr:MAG: hypothetical protein EA349_05810 [Halomonadaceae bacterium]
MKQGAAAVLLIALLSGCASGYSGYREHNPLLQWIFQSNNTPEETASVQGTEPERDTLKVVTLEKETDITSRESHLTEHDSPVTVTQTSAADPEPLISEPVTREAVTDERAEAGTSQASQESSQPEPPKPEPAQPESDTPPPAARAEAAPPAPAPAPQTQAEPQAEPQSHTQSENQDLVRVVIPYANTPFPHLSPQQHPPLTPQEYRQVQQALTIRQQSGEDTQRYQGEIARARSEGGVMAWFYRLWLQ